MKATRTPHHILHTASAVASCVLTLFPAHAHANPPQYTVTVLGAGPAPNGINVFGQVAGQSVGRAVRWTGTTPTNLGMPPGGTQSWGFGINAAGQVAGYFYQPVGNGVLHAVRWTGTTPTDLGTLGGTSSSGIGINDSGQVAGTSAITGNTAEHAVRWTGTTPTDLGTLGGLQSAGYGINASGQVVGQSDITGNTTGNGVTHATLWTGTTPTDLGTLGGNSAASAINVSGQVAGYYYLAGAGGPTHAMRWTGTTPTDLGTLGGSQSYGLGINDSGDVIGDSYTTDDAAFHAFLYTAGTMYDLNDLLLPGSGVTNLSLEQSFTGLGAGNSINDFGQVAAVGDISGSSYALILTPTPEPASVALLLGGGLLLGLRRRR